MLIVWRVWLFRKTEEFESGNGVESVEVCVGCGGCCEDEDESDSGAGLSCLYRNLWR